MLVRDRPVAAVTATTTTPNSIHKMSTKKMTRFLSTVDSFLGAAPNMRQGGREVAWHWHEGILDLYLGQRTDILQR